jgi:hypothetical protein
MFKLYNSVVCFYYGHFMEYNKISSTIVPRNISTYVNKIGVPIHRLEVFKIQI